ncbi:MAG TPA: MBOAT family protein [Chthoniobacter sp.]
MKTTQPASAPASESIPTSLPFSHPQENRRPGWLGWLPLAVFPTVAASVRQTLTPWVFMWAMAVALFAAFKWQVWWKAVRGGRDASAFRSLAFLFLWPGMDADRFLSRRRPVAPPTAKLWLFALAKTVFGAGLLWGVARLAGNELLAGWMGMVGLIFFLHFGTLHLLSLFWQWRGIDARPLMSSPVSARSLGEFWGKRWNAGFRDLAFGLWFVRLRALLSPRLATLTVFLISGLIHELAITIPARAGYGLPTCYFLIQGTGVLGERTCFGAGLRRTWAGRIFTIATVTLPVFALFPAPFVLRVMVPFFHSIKALP